MSPARLGALACLSSLLVACSSSSGAPATSASSTSSAAGGHGGSGGSGSGGSGGASTATGGSGGAAPADAGTGGQGGSPACKLTKPYSSKNAACNACAEQYCCPQINACYGDASCDDGYVNCTIGCALDADPDGGADAGIDPCLAICAQQFPKGKLEYDAAIGCAAEECAVECQ
jgi:hypothetical protein